MNYYTIVNFGTLLLTSVLAWSLQAAKTRYSSDMDYTSRRYGTKSRRNRSDKPNIIVILTDDQDELLGSMHVMPKTLRIMRDQGVHFNNSFVSTPMCCPSRSSFLTGMYTHNHHVYTNNDNCSSLYWQRTHETRSFSTYLNDVGYRTGYFGKYLNEYNGTYIPPGWREWVGLIRNSRFYNYSINFNGNKIKKGDNYYDDYFTDLIANDSVTFLKQSKQYFPRRPVLMVLSTPAPHGPEDSAPQYQHLFYNNTLHRTPTWNMAPNLDKQYLLKITNKLEPIEQRFTDVLAQKRLQTLQSVDDLVEKVYNELRDLGELDNTYMLYTSDHGYHLGQFGLAKGKALPYDFDVRVPLYMRGPGIRGRSKISNIALNIDVAPTILDMAGVDIPEHMDGRSLFKLIKSYRDPENIDEMNFVSTRKPWRETILLERGKMTMKKIKKIMREQKKNFINNLINMPDISDDLLQFATPKQRRIYRECAKPENKSPCKVGQKYHCIHEKGRTLPRLQKCRSKNMYDTPLQKDGPKKRCLCRPQNDGINRLEKKIQRKFLKTYANKEFRPKFIRSKRSYAAVLNDNIQDQTNLDDGNMARKYHIHSDVLNSNNQDQTNLDDENMARYQPFDRRCRELPNNTISCDQQLYQDATEWKNHKDKLDEMIQEYRKMLEDLRNYRRHLKKLKPKESFLSQYDDEINQYFSQNNVNRIESAGTTEPCDCDDDFDLERQKQERKEQIKERRRRRKERRRRKLKKKRKNIDCNKPEMKCFTHDNDHWKTPPLWDSSYWNLPTDEKLRRRNHPACKRSDSECYLMDNTHWKTPPYWKNGPFCFCTNSNNNTYWCIRTINQTHDLLYCEFVNNFISYYDMKKDPFQMKNAIHDVNYGVLQQLHEQLNDLRACHGHRECEKASEKYHGSGDRRLQKNDDDEFYYVYDDNSDDNI